MGKSALTIRLTQAEFANEYDPTIEDSYRYYCEIDGVKASLDILDTAGQEEYSSMRDMYMKTGEGFMLVFSLTDRASFEEIASFYNQIMRVKGESVPFVPMMMVGNKSDLSAERQITQEEGIALAQRFNCAYIETSAKIDENVTDAFHGVVKMIMGQSLMGVNLDNTLYPTQLEQQNAKITKPNANENSTNVKSSKTPNQKSKKSGNTDSTGGCCVLM